jgi:hypothetical protein
MHSPTLWDDRVHATAADRRSPEGDKSYSTNHTAVASGLVTKIARPAGRSHLSLAKVPQLVSYRMLVMTVGALLGSNSSWRGPNTSGGD